MTENIEEFRGPTRWLSNFHYADITMPDGVTYPTTEHAFQAQKTLDIEHRKWVAKLSGPKQAKHAGRGCELREDWEDIKYAVMKEVTQLKFEHKDLRQKLLDTGDAQLTEGNDWGDRTWGMVNGTGKNYLGRILMEVREEIRGETGVYTMPA